MQGGGSTIAVLGCGVDVVYPREHGPLLEAVAAAGAVVSELAAGVPPLAFHFPRRNRIISGLSLAVVVVEASEQGREVMAVPGNVLNGRCRGGHGLIRDGAKVVETADDILEELLPKLYRPRPVDRTVPEGQSEEDLVLRQMDRGESYGLDQLAELSCLQGPSLASHVLELDGRVVRLETGRFCQS